LSDAESGAPDGSSHLSIKRHVPMQIRRRGVELRLVIDSGARASCKTDQSLLNVVVVYKVDRLTRSLSDFAKMVEVFDSHGVSFVAVTQQFNTTSSMGR